MLLYFVIHRIISINFESLLIVFIDLSQDCIGLRSEKTTRPLSQLIISCCTENTDQLQYILQPTAARVT